MRIQVSAVIGLTALVLASCSKQADQPPAPSEQASELASLDATPENAPGTTLSEATVQLPAVPGRPGVAYFTLSLGSGPARRLVAVHVDGAGKAQMHENTVKNGVTSMDELHEVALDPGKSVVFKPGGNHVMLFELAPGLKAGGVTELTITLDNGDKATTKARVLAAGETVPGAAPMDHDMKAMEGMDMGDMSDHDMSDHDRGAMHHN